MVPEPRLDFLGAASLARLEAGAGMAEGPRRNPGASSGRPAIAPGPDRLSYSKMLMARAATSRTVIDETLASLSIASLIRRVSGMASVGLKAIELVNET